MPETSSTSPVHSHHSSSRRSSSHRNQKATYLEPVFYFAGAILFLIGAKLLDASLLAPSIGAIGIVLLAISKLWKFRTGLILSTVCLLSMTMLYIWQWADHYLVAIFTAKIAALPWLFTNGLIDNSIQVLIMWVYYRLLRSINMRMSQEWFVKNSYVKFFKLLFYFQLLLLFFWIFSLLLLKMQRFTLLNTQDSAMISGALALLSAGIPAIAYISKGAAESGKRHRHRQHYRHDQAGLLKNPESE